MNIAQEMLTTFNDNLDWLKKVITGDESWVYANAIEIKAQSSQWKLPEARQVRPNLKVLLTVFFDCNGMVHHEFLPQSRAINNENYLEVIRRLREAVRHKRTVLWKNQSWILHHDNASALISMLVREF